MRGTVGKEALVQIVSAETGESKAVVRRVLEKVIDTVKSETAEGKQIVLRGFGKFYLAYSPERRARNPRTGDEVKVPPRRLVRFRPSKNLRWQA